MRGRGCLCAKSGAFHLGLVLCIFVKWRVLSASLACFSNELFFYASTRHRRAGKRVLEGAVIIKIENVESVTLRKE